MGYGDTVLEAHVSLVKFRLKMEKTQFIAVVFVSGI